MRLIVKWPGLAWRCIAAVSLAAILVACGGGGGGTTPANDGGSGTPAPPVTESPKPPLATPTIDRQPASQSVLAGASVTFSVGIADATGVTYQWLRQGVDIPGATQATYTLTAATTADSGSRWSVRVSNAGGSVPSTEALLTVTLPPVQPALAFVAGDPGGIGNVDATGRWARFNRIGGIAVDASGVVYAADTGNRTLRKIAPDGAVTTLAGMPGQAGTVDGIGNAARFASPTDVVVMPDGTLLVADNDRVRRVTSDGVVTTLSTPGLPAAKSLVVDAQGVVFISTGSAVWKMLPNTAPFTYAGFHGIETTYDGQGVGARFDHITHLAIDSAGTTYVAQYYGPLRKISPQGFVSTFRNTSGNVVQFNYTGGLALDAAGTLWVSSQMGILSKVAADGTITQPFATTEDLRKDMSYAFPGAIAFNPAGELVFAGLNGVAKIDAGGRYSELAGSVLASRSEIEDAHAMATNANDALYLAHAMSNVAFGITKYSLAGAKLNFGPSGSTVQLGGTMGGWSIPPFGLGVTPAGDVILGFPIVDSAISFSPVQVRGGNIVSVGSQGSQNVLAEWSGGGASAIAPAHLVVDRQGDAWFVDLQADRLMHRTLSGALSVVAEVGPTFNRVGFPDEVFVFPIVGAAGQIYVSNKVDHTIGRVEGGKLAAWVGAAGVSGSADGPAAQARFQAPGPGVVDSKGNLYVADGELIRRITPEGAVSTLAGVAGRVGLTPGKLPASLGIVRALALASDQALFVLVDRALLRVDLP